MPSSGSTQVLVRRDTGAVASLPSSSLDNARQTERSLKCLQSQLKQQVCVARALSTSSALRQQPTLSSLPQEVRAYVEEKQRICQPSTVHVCDGSDAENSHLLDLMLKSGSIVPLPKYRNCIHYEPSQSI